MTKTKIEWADDVWNPIVGCSVVSPGCTNCYAMRQAAQIERMQNSAFDATYARKYSPYRGLTIASKAGPVWNGKVALASDDALTAPLHWKRRRRVFVNSMGDLFHEAVPDAWIDRVFAVMTLAPLHHIFIILTKRSKRMREYLSRHDAALRWVVAARELRGADRLDEIANVDECVDWSRNGLPNVWLGVSCEDQERADERIPDLLTTPAAVRIVSAEPLLGPIDFMKIDLRTNMDLYTTKPRERSENDPDMRWPLLAPFDHWPSGYSSPGLDWIIVGGESGRGARPMGLAWARAIVRQCREASVPCFVKQLGRRPIEEDGGCSYGISDPKGGSPAEWPEDLRVREWP